MTNQVDMQSMMAQMAQMMQKVATQQQLDPKTQEALAENEKTVEALRTQMFDRIRAKSESGKEALKDFLSTCGFAEEVDILMSADKIASSAGYGYMSTRLALENMAMYESPRISNRATYGVEGSMPADQQAMDTAERQAQMKDRCEALLNQYFAAHTLAEEMVKELHRDEEGAAKFNNIKDYLRAPEIDETDRAFNDYVAERDRKRNAERAYRQASSAAAARTILFS